METLADPHLTRGLSPAKTPKTRLYDPMTSAGYIFLMVSSGLYGLEEYLDLAPRGDKLAIFFVHYFIALAYVGVLIVNRSFGLRRTGRKEHFHKTIILLNLFLVSAYALNRVIGVFENSVTWLCVYLGVASATMLSYHYFDYLPRAVNRLQHVLLGCVIVLYVYMTIYVANLYPLGTVGTILLGIGAHIFVPLFLLIATIRLLVLSKARKRVSAAWALAGVILPIVFAAGFVIEWRARVQGIDRIANLSVIRADTELPAWIKVAQQLQRDWITERILKSRFVYTVPNGHFDWDLFPFRRGFDEQRKHDPLVFIASGNSHSSLSDDDRKNILKAITDSRHSTQERLWSGENLTTSYIVSDADIYPELRIAYTEHYLNIRNSSPGSLNSQEAIYTFQLPEGSVITSLSLWVNGKEEKGILTSKQKAAEAYTTIVGRERRDPSLVQWQEGNTVTVRVFPCTPEEERKFKIGITSPLEVVGDQVLYRNVAFRGPNAYEAAQMSRIRIIGNAEPIEIPDHFSRNENGEYISEASYDADLVVAMPAVPIRSNQFSFDGFVYSLSPHNPATAPVVFMDIYLDINNSWTSSELESLQQLTGKYRVYAFVDHAFIRLSSENWDERTADLAKGNFSLFPFHRLKDTENVLVVTKGRDLSPHLRDVNTSAFAEGIRAHFASGRKVYVFNLEGGTSTYIRSLKELRAFHFAHGNTAALSNILKNRVFPLAGESENRVVLHESDMVIERKPADGNETSNAPDHLARLFAYNNIMRQVAVNFFDDDFVNEELVHEATKAYVVSPVSSLIVLETQEDYDRFGIEDMANSLHNAGKNSSGAVPEPHEWALIIVFVVFVGYHAVRYARFKIHFFQR